uniref:DDE_3 domain-containing protein n=1 Tax=Haemonchus contortus TaxID=6289 RepID=A0A7I4YLY6_HAECO
MVVNDVLPWAQQNMPDGWILQQENDLKHTSGIVKAAFDEQNVRLLHWPSQSSDLNPIEQEWEEPGRLCSKRTTKNKDEKFAQLRVSTREIHQRLGGHHSVIYRTIKRFRQLGTEDDRSGRVRRATVATTEGNEEGAVKGAVQKIWEQTTFRVLFTEEKLFTVEQGVSKRNDRVYAVSNPHATVGRSSHLASATVFTEILADGKTPQWFVPGGTKQDGAPAHRSTTVQQCCKQTSCSKSHRSVNSLKRAPEKTWDKLNVRYLLATVDAFPELLKACVEANGGVFEIH